MIQRPASPIHIASIASAVPAVAVSQSRALELIEQHYAAELKPRSLELLRQFLAHDSIKTRHIAVDRPEDVPLLKDEPPDQRIERFTRFAVSLGEEAAAAALAKVSIDKNDVAAIIVNTCTGYICPGLSTYLIRAAGPFAGCSEVYDLVRAGCGGRAARHIQMAEAHV